MFVFPGLEPGVGLGLGPERGDALRLRLPFEPVPGEEVNDEGTKNSPPPNATGVPIPIPIPNGAVGNGASPCPRPTGCILGEPDPDPPPKPEPGVCEPDVGGKFINRNLGDGEGDLGIGIGIGRSASRALRYSFNTGEGPPVCDDPPPGAPLPFPNPPPLETKPESGPPNPPNPPPLDALFPLVVVNPFRVDPGGVYIVTK